MADRTKIEWTDATWNPIRGCLRVSEGCQNCYAERLSARFSGPGQPYEGLAVLKDGQPRWTGAVRFLPEKLDQPLRWKTPRRIFVNSTSDLFFEKLETARIDEIFAVMALARQHQFQVLTKRVKRMCEYTFDRSLRERIRACAGFINDHLFPAKPEADEFWSALFAPWPQKHIWLGASAENQLTYDARRLYLGSVGTEGWLHWWSLEPLLGPIRLGLGDINRRRPDWVVVGGESGPHARPMHPEWVRRIRDECLENKVPFFFKQWGEWVPRDQTNRNGERAAEFKALRAAEFNFIRQVVYRVGKANAGRELDGMEWNEYPEELWP